MDGLIKETILPLFQKEMGEIPLSDLDDSAVIDDMVFTTDGHTVKPISFPGGDLGSIAVAGTVNDLLALGAKPVGLSLAMVIPEGFPMDDLESLLKSASETCDSVDVPVLTGDTKVVSKDELDEPMITTSGLGKRHPTLDQNFELAGGRKTRWLSDNNLEPGDKIVVTGTLGDHGITVLSKREGYGFEGELQSDIAPLVNIMQNALKAGGVASAKDPTRGGLAHALNEWADKSRVGIEVNEEKIPVRGWVSSASEMLGIDPLTIGNEGKFVLSVNRTKAKDVLEAVRKSEHGGEAEIIGEVKEDIEGVVLKTEVGGRRILEPPVSDPVPRIC